jgi:ACS family D-galactonate transporter-like MFS transporter
MTQAANNQQATRFRYGMLSLVFVNVVINYLDRSNLAVAGSQISAEYDLSDKQMGLIFSSFSWAYAFLQIPGGILADKFGPRVLYAFCLVTWSLATMTLGLARGFTSFFGIRLAIGALEAPSYPINNRVVTSWFPDNERAGAIAIYVSGQFIGLAFLSPVLVLLQYNFGFSGMFVTTGLIGLAWGLIWYFFYRDPSDHPKVNQAELDHIEQGGGLLKGKVDDAKKSQPWTAENFKKIFSNSTLWGVYIAQFCVNAMLWFFLTWFPTYLVKFRGLDFVKSGFLQSIPFVAACAGLLLSGFISDWLAKKGWSVAMARKVPIITGLLISVSIIGPNYTSDTVWVIFFLSTAFFGAGMALISWVFVSILSPKHLVGLTGGVFNFMGNLAGIAVPIVIGFLVSGGNFDNALVFIGILGFIGAMSYIFLVRKVERIV